VDTFGLEYYLNPRKALLEMKRVCKPGGKVLLLNMGLPESKFLQYYFRLNLPFYLLEKGYFPHRPWDKIVKTMDFEVVHSHRYQGNIYYQILINNKEEKESQEIQEKKKGILSWFW